MFIYETKMFLFSYETIMLLFSYESIMLLFTYEIIMLLFTYGQIFLLLLLSVAMDKEVTHLLLGHKHLENEVKMRQSKEGITLGVNKSTSKIR